MAVPLPNQIPGLKKKFPDAKIETRSQSESSVSSGPGPQKSSPKKTPSNGNSTKADAHTIRERTDEDITRDPYICACGESFVSENDSYRHVKAHKPAFVRPDHLNDRPLRGHEGLQALKQSLEGERKRPQNNRRQPRRAK